MRIRLTLLLCLTVACTPSIEHQEPETPVEEIAVQEPVLPPDYREEFIIPRNSTTYTEFKKVGFSSQEVFRLVENSKAIHRLDRIPARTAFYVSWTDPSKTEKTKLEVQLSKTKILTFNLGSESWVPEITELPIEESRRTFSGVVKSSLWDSASSSGMESSLIPELAEIFAWQIDFSREVRQGDLWRIVVDQKFVNGEPIGWGPILAAQYQTSAGELFTGVRFPENTKHASYYQEDGTSLRRLFLKSPIKFGRITSGFTNRRFHPILKRNRPHLGVDYAAPIGTPIRTIGDGRVVFAGRNGGSGKMIKIRHNSVYTTAYLHLNGYAKGIKKGAKVVQGQTIGYVGRTGLATGPHLHFSFYKHGRYVDPLGQKFPSADPVTQKDKPTFDLVAAKIIGDLPAWQSITNVAEEPVLEPNTQL